MGYSTWLLDVVRNEFQHDSDVPVRAVSGWQTRGNSDADHGGVMDHHTGSRPGSRYESVLNYIVTGSSISPLANIVTGTPYAPDLDDFPIHIVAAGQANHAGKGDLSWLSVNDGNDRTIGIEHYSTYDHGDWHPRHLEVQMRLDACLLEHMGQSWQRRADHKEYAPTRKVDRHHIDTVRWDRDLRDLMAARAAGTAPDQGFTVNAEEAKQIRKIVADEIAGLEKSVKSRRRQHPWTGGGIWDWLVDDYRDKDATVDEGNWAKRLRRDAAEARTNSAKTLSVVREIAKRGRLTDADLAAVEKAVEDTLAAGVDVDITVGGQ